MPTNNGEEKGFHNSLRASDIEMPMNIKTLFLFPFDSRNYSKQKSPGISGASVRGRIHRCAFLQLREIEPIDKTYYTLR